MGQWSVGVKAFRKHVVCMVQTSNKWRTWQPWKDLEKLGINQGLFDFIEEMWMIQNTLTARTWLTFEILLFHSDNIYKSWDLRYVDQMQNFPGKSVKVHFLFGGCCAENWNFDWPYLDFEGPITLHFNRAEYQKMKIFLLPPPDIENIEKMETDKGVGVSF